MPIRKIGVEEELMLVDPDTCALTAVSQQAIRAHEHGHDQASVGVHLGPNDGPPVEEELFLQQIETATAPCKSSEELLQELRRGRESVGLAAQAAGAVAVAVATPILLDETVNVTPKPRYERIFSKFGAIARQSMACAMHVHVDVESPEEAVAALNGVRPWLPVLLALSANSPYWRGEDTAYSSWRSEIWRRWPSTGTGEGFTNAEEYDEVGRHFVDWGAALDNGMLYFDARPSEKAPTLEIRVADVCTELEDGLLVALLSRALVETASRDWHAGRDLGTWRSDLLRIANWRAARYGASGPIVNPATRELAPVREVFEALVDHVRDALDDAGDTQTVTDAFERLVLRGSGSSRQRAVFESKGELVDVVRDLSDRTVASWKG